MVETRQQCRKRVMWSMIESEQGILINILSRLPVRSIRSFQTVNRYWYGSVRNNFFAKKQLNQSKENPSFIASPIMGSTMKLYSMKPGSFELSYVNTIYPTERSGKESMYMISSFNGLICCINRFSDKDVENKLYDLQIWICNPCTGKTLLLPQGSRSFHFLPIVGVAYYSDISDYKVFRIFCAGKRIPEEGESVTTYRYAVVYECEVYSSNTGSWKNIGPVPCVPMYSLRNPFRYGHVFIGGKIYWLSSLNDPGEILSVDLEGRFEVINLPQYPDDLKEEDMITEATYLINLRGSLSVVVLHTDYMDIWAWKKDGEKCSWVLLCKDYIPFGDHDLVLAMTWVKNQILCMTETHWCSYDVDTRIWNKKRAKYARFVNPAVFPFTESLLPCNGGVML